MEPLASSLIEEFDLTSARDHLAVAIFGDRVSLNVGVTVAGATESRPDLENLDP